MPTENYPAVLIVADDHPLFRSALLATVAQVLPGSRTLEAQTIEELSTIVAAHPETDLILLDLRMPGAQGFSSLIQLRGQYPAIPVAIVSAQEEPATMRRAMDFGATGFIPKSAGIAQIAEALSAMLAGSTWLPPGVNEAANERDADDRQLALRIASLTPQQFRVLMMLADGRLNKQIASQLDVTEATVKAHVTAILRKLGLYRRTQAAVLAQNLMRADSGMIAPGDVPPDALIDESDL